MWMDKIKTREISSDEFFPLEVFESKAADQLRACGESRHCQPSYDLNYTSADQIL